MEKDGDTLWVHRLYSLQFVNFRNFTSQSFYPFSIRIHGYFLRHYDSDMRIYLFGYVGHIL